MNKIIIFGILLFIVGLYLEYLFVIGDVSFLSGILFGAGIGLIIYGSFRKKKN
ncbi:MAG: hypothetical protein AAF688_07735 [Bacteroidota bacterium]